MYNCVQMCWLVFSYVIVVQVLYSVLLSFAKLLFGELLRISCEDEDEDDVEIVDDVDEVKLFGE